MEDSGKPRETVTDGDLFAGEAKAAMMKRMASQPSSFDVPWYYDYEENDEKDREDEDETYDATFGKLRKI